MFENLWKVFENEGVITFVVCVVLPVILLTAFLAPNFCENTPQAEWYTTPYGVCTNVENGKLCRVKYYDVASVVYIPNN